MDGPSTWGTEAICFSPAPPSERSAQHPELPEDGTVAQWLAAARRAGAHHVALGAALAGVETAALPGQVLRG